MSPDSITAAHAGAVVIFLHFHWRMTHEDVTKSVGKLARFLRASLGGAAHWPDEAMKRIDAAMDQLREDSYVETSKLMMHVNGMSLVLIPFIYPDDKMFLVGILLAAAAAYATHLALATRKITLRAHQLKMFIAVYYIIGSLCSLFGHFADSKLATVGQLTLFACLCDRNVHIPGQLALALTEIFQSAASAGWQGLSADIVGSPLLSALILIFSVVVLENTMREGLAAQFRGADAESMVASFRRMLRGLSDAELLLDESLQVVDDDDLLRGLLARSETLVGQVFANLLIQDTEEQERFHNFINRSNQSTGTSQATMPQCLRVSLRTSRAQRAGADLFHVRIPHLYGCAGAYHLLAFKLDTDVELAMSKDEKLDELVFGRHTSISTSVSEMVPPSQRSVLSDQATGSFLEALQAFSAISMQVDRATNPKVISIHFNYRRSHAGTGNKDRPALRRFIRPTQWARFSDMITGYLSASSADSSSRELGEVWIPFGHPSQYRLARRAQLRAASNSGQLWIDLKDVRLPTAAGRGEMMYIGEDADEQVDGEVRTGELGQ